MLRVKNKETQKTLNIVKSRFWGPSETEGPQQYQSLTPMDFWPRNGLHQKSKSVTYGKETYVGWGVRASCRWSMATEPRFFSEIAMNDHFQYYQRLTPTDFWPKKVSTKNPRMWSMARKHMWGELYETRVDDQRPFSIIPNANTYGFWTKKWSPPEIQECDLWQGNIYGVSCTRLIDNQWPHNTHFCQK
jgi:hypothetical protein